MIRCLFSCLVACWLAPTPNASAQVGPSAEEISVDWGKTTGVSHATPTLQVVVNPQLASPGGKMHEAAFRELRSLGAEDVRYVPWLPYPRRAVAELQEPADGKTFWNFELLDATLDDFMKATDGHRVILNFSTIPAWMYKTRTPVTFPDDPDQVFWGYTQGTELRDPTMQEVADYFARLVGWYTEGGFTDEAGKRHDSGHHYRIAFWEVLNEIDLEHHWTPEQYTRFYDVVTSAIHKVNPDIKFVGMALAQPSLHPEMFEYFLNPANHHGGQPVDMISYHFYASPSAEDTIDQWRYRFFDQADGFLNTVRFAETIRKRYAPTTKTDLNEVGVILPEDNQEIRHQGYVGKEPSTLYWNLAAALYAYLYAECAKLGIDVIGESQLVGYHSQFPSVSMMDYETFEPNARFRVLQLLKENFGPGDKIVPVKSTASASVEGFSTARGRRLLLIGRKDHPIVLRLPADATGGTVTFVAASTGSRQPQSRKLIGRTLTLEAYEVAVVAYP